MPTPADEEDEEPGLLLKPKPIPMDEDAGPPPLTERVEEEEGEEEPAGSGKGTLIVALVIILLLLGVGGGAVYMMLGSMGGDSGEIVVEAAQPMQPAENKPEPESKMMSGPLQVIQQAEQAVATINNINQNLSDQLEESTAAPVAAPEPEPARPEVEAVPEPVIDVVAATPAPPVEERRIVSVSAQSVQPTQTVIQPVATNSQPAQLNAPVTTESNPGSERAQLARSVPKDASATEWIRELYIPSHSETMQKITIGSSVYTKGDLVSEDLQLSLFHVTRHTIYFEDMRGAIYLKAVR